MHNRNTGGEERGTEETVEAILIENFLKLMIDIESQSQEPQRTPSRINTKKKKRHLDISYLKFRKSKTKTKSSKKLQGEVGECIIYGGAGIRSTSDFSSETRLDLDCLYVPFVLESETITCLGY